MATKLKVTDNYRDDSRNLVFLQGQEIQVEDELAKYLLNASPGSFEKAMDKPPADKAMPEPAASKPKAPRRSRRKPKAK